MQHYCFCICLLQLGHLLKSMYISVLSIMSFSVTLDTVNINQILLTFWKFLSHKEYSKVVKIWTHFCYYKNAYKCSCSPRTDVVKVVPKVLYIAMIDSLRQQFYPRIRQACRDNKISDSHRKRYSCPMNVCECIFLVLLRLKIATFTILTQRTSTQTWIICKTFKVKSNDIRTHFIGIWTRHKGLQICICVHICSRTQFCPWVQIVHMNTTLECYWLCTFSLCKCTTSPVNEPSLDVIVRHVSSRASFSFIVEQVLFVCLCWGLTSQSTIF